MSKTEKVHQFLTAYQRLQLESYADSLFDEFSLQASQVVWLETCGSTSHIARERSAENPLQPFVCISDTQDAGVGQHERSWFSPQGNLHFSMYIPISRHVSESEDFSYIDGRLSLETAIALLNMQILQPLRLSNAFKAGIKWPNDLCILPRDPNSSLQDLHKFSGILIEPVKRSDNQEKQGLVGVIFGIGMNTNHTETQRINDRPIANLQKLLNYTISLPDLAAQACQACQKALDTYFNHASSLPVRYFTYDLLYDKPFSIAQSQNTVTGVGAGVQEDGALLLMQSLELTLPVYSGAIQLQ